ncbi:MAG TPA: tyrosine-protein phosphatase [Bradyrhizobium sp.]|nr:tyrosine-protein phosphatase [Bradyrhizobium sp.]
MTTITPANFATVDAVLWRGARPDAAQAGWLFANGVRGVINLELFEEDRAAWDGLAVDYRHLPDWEPLALGPSGIEDRHIKAVLAAIREMPKPIYIHCRDGQNRTGIAVATYCLVEKGEPLDAVLADMKSYRGAWAAGDASYLRSLAGRVAEFR